MIQSRQRFWTRKDVARVLEISVDNVRDNEANLGLNGKAKIQINSRVVRYRTSLAIAALQRLKADLAPYPDGATLSKDILRNANV